MTVHLQVNVPGRGRIFAVQDGDAHVFRYDGEPCFRVEPFARHRTELAEQSPSWLLSAHNEVVAFQGRAADLAQLARWRDAPGAARVRLLHAVGGQGKTRLAMRFAELSRRRGWTVLTVHHHGEAAAGVLADQAVAVGGTGLLLVVDYADRWPATDLAAMVRAHLGAARLPVRLLLLARSHTGWWESIAPRLPDGVAVDTAPVAALSRSPAERERLFAAAWRAFARIRAPGLAPPPAPVPACPGDGYDQVLAIHVAALAGVEAARRGEAPPSADDQAGLVAYLLHRERDQWLSYYEGHGGFDQDRAAAAADRLGRVVFTATLTGARPPEEAARVLAAAGVGGDGAAALLRDHRRCYPPGAAGTVLEPLTPDRLGEDFIALQLPGHRLAADVYGADPWTAGVPSALLPVGDDPLVAGFVQRAVATLTAAAQRWEHVRTTQLYPLLARAPRYALLGGDAVLSAIAALPDVGPDLLDRIEASFPGHLVGVDVGLAAVMDRLARQRLAAEPGPLERAVLLERRAQRLAVLGRADEAAADAVRCVELYEQAGPSGADRREDLYYARSLAATALQQAGRSAEALAMRRGLLALLTEPAAPRLRRHAARLADLHHDLSLAAARLGHRDEALAHAAAAVRALRADPAGSAVRQAALSAALRHHAWLLGGGPAERQPGTGPVGSGGIGMVHHAFRRLRRSGAGAPKG
ncbi:hypothetical protein Cs7R123_49070 [Catellatospora sp. TT07R-123]|uniref:hypothetical protein n=1 Tax=Catellatospora sp. TT07R-123 TaxID=2733863 RepID=UPI001B2B77AD|nr:hypothetical protein [Catellatospora sp. TT07R-123]GHJ47565.1 hypothetical protein Cs7R123_49070 [Catellatospora sp. TT07R-123]